MLKALDKNKSFALFLRGFPIREIAKKTGISRSTIERWSSREQWVANREEAQHISQREVAKKMLNDDPRLMHEATSIAVTELKISFELVQQARDAGYNQKIVSRLYRQALENTRYVNKMVNTEIKYCDQIKTAHEIDKMYREKRSENKAAESLTREELINGDWDII